MWPVLVGCQALVQSFWPSLGLFPQGRANKNREKCFEVLGFMWARGKEWPYLLFWVAFGRLRFPSFVSPCSDTQAHNPGPNALLEAAALSCFNSPLNSTASHHQPNLHHNTDDSQLLASIHVSQFSCLRVQALRCVPRFLLLEFSYFWKLGALLNCPPYDF